MSTDNPALEKQLSSGSATQFRAYQLGIPGGSTLATVIITTLNSPPSGYTADREYWYYEDAKIQEWANHAGALMLLNKAQDDNAFLADYPEGGARFDAPNDTFSAAEAGTWMLESGNKSYIATGTMPLKAMVVRFDSSDQLTHIGWMREDTSVTGLMFSQIQVGGTVNLEAQSGALDPSVWALSSPSLTP